MRIRIVVLLLLAQVCLGEQPWEKKPFQKWSAKEVEKVLADSPWAKTVVVGTTNLSLAGSGPSRAASSRSNAGAMEMSLDASHENAPRISYQVQLRSSMPIRQAIARKLQIDNKYDSLPNERRDAVDAKIKEYLAQTFDDVVVVQVIYSSNVTGYFSDVRRFWMSQNAEQLKGSMFLNAGGKKLEPTSFLAGDNVFQVTFERNREVAAGSNLSLEFQNPQFGLLPAQRVFVPFNPKDMAFNGALTF